MTYRVHRTMAKAIGVFMLLWLSGSIWLGFVRSQTSGFRQVWQREFGNRYTGVFPGTEDGLYVLHYEGYRSYLSSITLTGDTRWTMECSMNFYGEQLHERDGTCFITDLQRGFLAIESDGNIAFEVNPPSYSYANFPVGEDTIPASFFFKQGVLLYGLSEEGEVCWVVNTGSQHGFSQLPAQLTRGGQPFYLIHDGQSLHLIDRHGSAELQQPPKAEVSTSQFAAPGIAQVHSIRDMNLVAILDDGALLYSNGHTCEVQKGSESSSFSLGGSNQNHGWGMIGKISSGEGKLLLPQGDSGLVLLDENYHELWSMDLQDMFVDATAWCDGNWVVLVSTQDSIVRSILSLDNMLRPLLRRVKFPRQSGVSQNMSGEDRSAQQLLCIRDGRITGRLDLGTGPQSYRFYNMCCREGRVFISSSYGDLRCLEPGVAQ